MRERKIAGMAKGLDSEGGRKKEEQLTGCQQNIRFHAFSQALSLGKLIV